jgi:hypothetical protein
MNGLIFPYRRETAKSEAWSTNLRPRGLPFLREGDAARLLGPILVVGQRRSDAEGQPAAEVVFRGQARSPSRRQIRGA